MKRFQQKKKIQIYYRDKLKKEKKDKASLSKKHPNKKFFKPKVNHWSVYVLVHRSHLDLLCLLFPLLLLPFESRKMLKHLLEILLGDQLVFFFIILNQIGPISS
jgi:hypothetical protein